MKCSNLVSIEIPDSVTSIGSDDPNCLGAFESCKALKTVRLPQSLTNIGTYTFQSCTALKALALLKGITSIGLDAFKKCSKLTVTVYPDSYALSYCKSNKISYVLYGPSKVTLKPSKVTLGVGETLTLNPTVDESEYADYTFASSKASVASVSATGKITAKKSGTATITVKTQNKAVMATFTVTVKAKPTKLTVSPAKVTLRAGETQELTVKLTPAGALRKLTYTSTNEAVAGVDENGLITAKTPGTATITITSFNKSVKTTCKVTVTE